MDWTLERMNVPNDFIVLKRNVRSYPCGRNPTNLIACPSLVVSRIHCTFVRTEDGISILDHGSSNGVWVDGNILEPHKLVELHEGNVIGIGSSEIYRDDEPMFVYKLHKGNLESRNLEQFDTLPTQPSTPLKRNLPPEKHHLPAKVCKLKNGIEEARASPPGPSPSGDNDEDIEELWSNFGGQTKTTEIVEKKTTVSSRSNRSTLNVNTAKKESKIVDLKNIETELTSPKRSNSSEEKKKGTSTGIASPSRSEAGSHKTFHLSIDATSSATRFTVDIMQSNVKDSTDSEKAKKEDRHKDSRPEKRKSNNRETEKKKTKAEKTKKKTEKVVETKKKKVEVVDTKKEEVETCSPKSSVETKVNSRLSFLNKDPVASSSPFKIKQVKREPLTSFSLIDVVDLSDDDDYVFPNSQLFDSEIENKPAENEDNRFSSPQENGSDEDDKDMSMGPDAMLEESQEIIALSDSEDEDNPWLERLSLSQRIKEEALEVPETPASPKIEFHDEIVEPPKSPEPEPPKESPIKPVVSPSTSRPRSLTVNEIEKDINVSEFSDSDEDMSAFLRMPTEKKKEQKGPKLIEPLHLPQKKRQSLRDSLSDPGSPAVPKPSTSKIRVRDCSVEVPKLPSNLTSKQKRELQLQDKIKQKIYEAEQRKRRDKNKWAQNVHLPVRKRKSLPLSKTQKLEIVNERKEKLKELAKKQKENSVKQPVERIAAKPKAKVSTKSRGDFLISEELRIEKEKTRVNPDPAEPSTSKKSEEKSAKSSSKRHEEKQKPSSRSSRKSRSQDRVSNEKSSSQDRRREKSVEKRIDESSKSVEKKVVEASPSVQKENREPNLLEKTENENKEEKKVTKKKKRVRFNDNKLVEVREFEILPGNTMVKCVGKDAAIPVNKMPKKKVVVPQHPRLEEFLMDIFQWNPSWIQEQKRLKIDPPVVDANSLIHLETNYKSYEHYYKTIRPLLLLEFWHGLSKESESIEKNNRRQVMFCSIVSNSVTFQPIPSTGIHLTTMMLEVLASEEDIRLQRHPVYGDLIFLELRYKAEEGKHKVLEVFAYVTQLHVTTITPNTYFNRDLMECTTNASKLLTYSILTRPLKIDLCPNKLIRMKCVMNLRSGMRMVQALQWLPKSPLVDLIVNPKVEGYNLTLPANHQQSHLVTGDPLNQRQIEAVFKVTEAIVKKEPKLCLVQGPPGTGKSQVIVNMVMQVLYGDNRYRNKDSCFRILLCAPSNAAIDEIVIRLLERRAKQSSDRFKMVRVGVVGCMHPKVKDISVEELAKRDVKRTITGRQSSGGSSEVEEKKRMWEAKINKLTLELSSTHEKDGKKMQLKKMKLCDARLKYYAAIKNCTQSAIPAIDPREMIKFQKAAENQLLLGADIIACTLSSCYNSMMEAAFGNTLNKISVCIVDEATQSCEAETLIPLMLGVNTLVLVGDPAQLPATVLSQKAKSLGLDQSLFSRTQRAFGSHDKSPVIMLDQQYRMNADILAWPNKYFYDKKLRNGLIGTDPPLPLHPYRVIDLESKQNSDKFSNDKEAEFVANLISGIISHLESKRIVHISIGVITPYRNQHTIVQRKINERISPLLENFKIAVNMAINTVDSFQGHERDVIIMSCVRSSGIGFLADRQRLCVALTRAKHCLVLCGNFGTFERNVMWRGLLSDAQSRRCYLEMKSDATPSDIVSHLVK